MRIRLTKSQRDKLPQYEDFFQELEKKFEVTRDDILQVVADIGLVPGQIRTYFLVQARDKKTKA